MTEQTLYDRMKVLSAFIRGQINLTDAHPHTPGPGSVKLNNEEATLCADALEMYMNGLERLARRAAESVGLEVSNNE